MTFFDWFWFVYGAAAMWLAITWWPDNRGVIRSRGLTVREALRDLFITFCPVINLVFIGIMLSFTALGYCVKASILLDKKIIKGEE